MRKEDVKMEQKFPNFPVLSMIVRQITKTFLGLLKKFRNTFIFPIYESLLF